MNASAEQLAQFAFTYWAYGLSGSMLLHIVFWGFGAYKAWLRHAVSP